MRSTGRSGEQRRPAPHGAGPARRARPPRRAGAPGIRAELFAVPGLSVGPHRSEAVPPAHRLPWGAGVHLEPDGLPVWANECGHVDAGVPRVTDSVGQIQRDGMSAESPDVPSAR